MMLLMLAQIIFHKPKPVNLNGIRARCLCCPDAPIVEDVVTHSRLCHTDRARGAEDSPEWSNQ